METATMFYFGLGLSLVTGLGLIIIYQNIKHPKKKTDPVNQKKKKKRK